MKIKQAEIELEDGTELNFPEMPLNDLAHEFIRICQPEYEIVIPETKLLQFEIDARKDALVNSTVSGFDSYVALFIKKECEKYTLTERHKQAYNSMVLAYSERLKKAEQ